MDLKYKELTLKVEETILGVVEAEAYVLGLTPEEMLRYIIGRWARSVTEQASAGVPFIKPPAHIAMVMGQPQPDIKAAWDMLDPNLKVVALASRLLIKRQIDNGEFKCSNCTQALAWKDFVAGHCGVCQAPIWPEEGQDKPGQSV